MLLWWCSFCFKSFGDHCKQSGNFKPFGYENESPTTKGDYEVEEFPRFLYCIRTRWVIVNLCLIHIFVACSDCGWFKWVCNHETVKKSQNWSKEGFLEKIPTNFVVPKSLVKFSKILAFFFEFAKEKQKILKPSKLFCHHSGKIYQKKKNTDIKRQKKVVVLVVLVKL